MTEAFGLTQYNFGAVVLTLKANGWFVGFDKVKYSVICLVNEPITKKKKRWQMLVSVDETSFFSI